MHGKFHSTGILVSVASLGEVKGPMLPKMALDPAFAKQIEKVAFS